MPVAVQKDIRSCRVWLEQVMVGGERGVVVEWWVLWSEGSWRGARSGLRDALGASGIGLGRSAPCLNKAHARCSGNRLVSVTERHLASCASRVKRRVILFHTTETSSLTIHKRVHSPYSNVTFNSL